MATAEDFMAITGVSSEEEAMRWLSMCDMRLDEAVSLFWTSKDLSASSSSSSHLTNQAERRRSLEDLEEFVEEEEEEEEEEVRRPDPVKRQRLLFHQDDFVLPSWKKRSPAAFSSGSGFTPSNTSEDVLQTLYRAPLEIMTNAPFDEAKEVAAASDKWLLVNIQNEEEFACHILNRDFWRSEEVRNLVACSFTFWQQLHISPQGKHFIERYRVKTFPFVAVLDPHTGALLWKREGREKVDPHSLAVRLQDFLGQYETPSKRLASLSKGNDNGAKSSSGGGGAGDGQVVDLLGGDDEEADLQKALALSLGQSDLLPPPPPPTVSASSVNDQQTATADSLLGFSAKDILASHATPSSAAAVVAGEKTIQLRVRMPAGGSVQTQLAVGCPVQQLLAFLAPHIITQEGEERRFDLYWGHPVEALSDRLKATKQSPEREESDQQEEEENVLSRSLESLGLTSNTVIVLRFL